MIYTHMPRGYEPRRYEHPGNLPGHMWADAAPMRRVGGRPVMTWKDTPFFLTGTPGSRERLLQRIQAHKDRLHILKAHHVQTSSHKTLAKIEKEIDKMEQRLVRDQRKLFGTPRALLNRQVYGTSRRR